MVAGMSYLTRRDYKRREGIHWNRRGHRRMAMILRTLVVSDGREPTANRVLPTPLPVRASSAIGASGSHLAAQRPDYGRSHD
jgi:hypothetical protein